MFARDVGGNLGLKMWTEEQEAWDTRAKEAEKNHPLRGLRTLPKMPGITKETGRFLKWKSFWWMLTRDYGGKVRHGFLRHPLRYGWAYFRSLFSKKSYKREGDFFLYGVESAEEFSGLLEDPDSLFVVGFSYCHKPFECPSGRFTDQCIHDENNLVCQQCFIGKVVHSLPEERSIPLYIPTVHYIGEKIFEIVHANPKKRILFLITACELTLEMFGDWGNMAGIQGIGVRLDGRICNTMNAFALSETGVKPGLTVVLDDTKEKILELVRKRTEHV